MANATLFTTEGQESGNVELPASVFETEVNGHVLYESVKSYLANQRQGTHKTKNRHERSGQKTKIYRQKGTGRARAGSATAGTRVGGGRIHGPRPRDYHYAIPRKVRRVALRSALTDRALGENILVVEDFRLEEPSTKSMAALFNGMNLGGKKVLFVGATSDATLVKSCRNIKGVETLAASDLNAYRVLHSDVVVLMQSTLETIKEVFGE